MFLPRLRRSLPKNLYRIGGIGFFSFADNLSLTSEQIEKKKNSAPKGNKAL